MNPSAPIEFDLLLAPAERILCDCFASVIHIVRAELLTDLERRNRLWRCEIDCEPGTLIMKQVAPDGYDPGNPDAEDTQRFLGDWAGAQFLTQVCEEAHGPRFYGGDLQAGFILMEDLGEQHSLIEPLLEGNRVSATQALLAYARRLGRMHASSLGHEDAYDAIRRAIYPQALPRITLQNQSFCSMVDQVQGYFATTGIDLGDEARRDLYVAYSAVFGPGPFRTFLHIDPCPDNVFYDGDTLRLIDFEFSRFGHALHDGLYCRVPFPTCWCSNRVPADVVTLVERAYRSELAETCPAALDDALFGAGVANVTAYWACECLRWVQEVLDEDHRWGISTIRPRILSRLETFVEAAGATGQLRALRTACEVALTTLSRRWPEAQPLPVYPAFGS